MQKSLKRAWRRGRTKLWNSPSVSPPPASSTAPISIVSISACTCSPRGQQVASRSSTSSIRVDIVGRSLGHGGLSARAGALPNVSSGPMFVVPFFPVPPGLTR